MDERARRKLDPMGRRFLTADGPDRSVRVLARGRGPFTDAQVRQLRDRGVRVGTVAGDVLTASVEPAGLDALAGTDFVAAIEVASALHPERTRPREADEE